MPSKNAAEEHSAPGLIRRLAFFSSAPKWKAIAALVIGGAFPAVLSLALFFIGGATPHINERVHESLEIVGSCIAFVVAIVLWLRVRSDSESAHLLWVAAALVAMGVIDGVHAVAPFGIAWSWLRHGATFAGGCVFALIWTPLRSPAVRRAHLFVLAAALSAALASFCIWWNAALLPPPFAAQGYTFWPKAVNFLGGLGFLAAAMFFFRRYLRQPRTEDLVFASQAILFGVASLLWGFSHLWAADWWFWHGARLLAYVGVLLAMYQLIVWDTTERKRSQAALESERRRFESVLDTLPALICLLTPNHEVAFANRTFKKEFGEPEGRKCYDYCFGSSQPCEFCEAYQVLEGNAPHDWECTTPNGVRLHVYDMPFADTDGSPLILEMNVDVTEQRRAEWELRKSESKYRTLLQSLPQKIAYKDRDSVYISCNENYARDLHMAPNELVGKTDYDFFPKELAEKYRNDDRRVMESGEPAQLEERYLHDGQLAWVSTVKTPVRDEQGMVNGVFVMFWDITARKRAEEKLQEASRYTRSLLEASLDPLVTISQDGKITDVNRASELATGCSRKELIGTDFCDYFTDPEKARQGYRQVFAEGTVRDYPLAIRHTTGRITDVLYSATVYKNQAGEVEGVFAAARDITERKQAEEKLRQASLYSRSLLEASLDPLVTISSDGKITDVNRASELATGCSRKELIGTDFCDYFTDPEKARQGYQQVFREGSVQDYELEILARDGRITPVLYNASVYRDDAGKVVGVFAAARDITGRKRAEEELARANAELECANEELAATNEKLACTNEELTNTNEELARSNEELSQFAYVASHDLQEPLRKIVAFGERTVAHAGPALGEQSRDYLERMQNAAQRMGQLIDSLLELSRVTTRGAKFEHVDLNKVLSEVLGDLEVRIQETGGRVEVGNLPTVLADRSQMRQLFQNLIGNALKFHRKGVPPLVRIHAHWSANRTWDIHVADNGIGFEEKYLDRIFKPFQRLNPRSEYAGSGMGLAICHKIMLRHAGRITAHSQPGVGTDFVLTLPAEKRAKEAQA